MTSVIPKPYIIYIEHWYTSRNFTIPFGWLPNKANLQCLREHRNNTRQTSNTSSGMICSWTLADQLSVLEHVYKQYNSVYICPV